MSVLLEAPRAGVAAANAEWLEADGRGGFASGRVLGPRTRRYHALLLAATAPPAGRVALVAGVEVEVVTPAGRVALSSQRYLPDVVHPDGAERVIAFAGEPWPTWTFELPDGSRVVHELFVPHGRAAVALSWRREPAPGATASGAAVPAAPGADALPLEVRPLLSGRDFHALVRENTACDLSVALADGDTTVRLRPYADLPPIVARASGPFAPAPTWYRAFRYDDEAARGLDFVEDLAAPGVFHLALPADGRPAVLLFGAGDDALPAGAGTDAATEATALHAGLACAERARRTAFASPRARAVDAYVVRRGAGSTIVAGYPWFGDWGRDTLIALRGLCLSTGRVDDARAILLEWAGAVSEGMLPNRFPDRGETPEYNAVDASLWFVIAVQEYLAALHAAGRRGPARERAALLAAVDAILDGYAAGTRYGIRADADGLLAAGEPGVQLTWMDARVDGREITPRIGKPVEVQALWLNALAFAGVRAPRFRELYARGRAAFAARFWDDARGWLADVVDADHVAGAVDARLRPNQLLALGGLPIALLTGARARRAVDAVERALLTPRGLRTLDPADPAYAPRYGGGVAERDGAYHQGTVWPWLLGPFVEAWLATRRRAEQETAAREARARFLAPLLDHLDEAGLGHVSEVFDAEPPHAPGGCPWQAWSLGELVRIDARLTALEGGAA